MTPLPPGVPAPLPPRRGIEVLHDPRFNKGTAFSTEERQLLGIRGLLPSRVFPVQAQARRNLEYVRRRGTDLERYVALHGIAERNETLFYRLLLDNLEELMPIVYTPTVGEACQRYGYVFHHPRGLFVSADDRGSIAEVLRNWQEPDVRVIVVTDGGRILGLGDLGAHGMGIPVGKLTLYTVCAGVHPRHCLPITLDVGTDNDELRADPTYLGLLRRRLQGADYDTLLDEFVQAVRTVFPRALLQFEDFGNQNAFRLLARYRDATCCFNDDIQGTAAVALAGLLAALRVTGRPLAEQRLLFVGAGEAGIGIADLCVAAAVADGADPAAARRICWLTDSKGLVVADRTDLVEHKRRYAHAHAPLTDLADIVRALRPTALVGVSAQKGVFTQPVVEALAAVNERPIVFALSNPTSKAECTAEQAYTWTQGRALFASGSPFPPFTIGGRTLHPGQGNNAYVFPGIGLGVVAASARRVVDAMFLAAARRLAEEVRPEDLARGSLYPPLARIREVSARIAVDVATLAFELGLADAPRPDDVETLVHAHVYEPEYPRYA